MKWSIVGCGAMFGAMLLTGCADGLIYGERTSLSLASIRVNDDPAEPVAVKLGFDRNVILVAPPIQGDVMEAVEIGGQERPMQTSKGEAVSQFSTFTVSSAPPFIPEGQVVSEDQLTDPDELLNVQTRFASGEAALAIAGDPEVVAAFMGVSTYVRDPAGDALRAFWKPDGSTIDTDNQEAIRTWMDRHGLQSEPSITYFMRAEEYAEQRWQAAKELGLLD